jgi:hypothetical protein
VQHTGNIANATAIQGHLENALFDGWQAALVTVLDEKRLRRATRIFTTVPLFPLGGASMLNHVGMLTSRTANLEDGHGGLRYLAASWLSGD